MLMEGLGVTSPQVPTTEVMQADKNGNVATREVVSTPAFTKVRDLSGHGAVRLFSGEGPRVVCP